MDAAVMREAVDGLLSAVDGGWGQVVERARAAVLPVLVLVVVVAICVVAWLTRRRRERSTRVPTASTPLARELAEQAGCGLVDPVADVPDERWVPPWQRPQGPVGPR